MPNGTSVKSMMNKLSKMIMGGPTRTKSKVKRNAIKQIVAEGKSKRNTRLKKSKSATRRNNRCSY